MSRPSAGSADLGNILLDGRSAPWRHVRRLVELVAPTAGNVLILGDPGTGKQYVARAIHQASPRRDGPCLVLQCGELTTAGWEGALYGGGVEKGLFAAARHGTLFLNGMAAIPWEVQQMFTSAACTDVRIVVASQGPLGVLMREQRSGGDLFYRLRLFPITVPALQYCPEDLPALIWELVRTYAIRYKRQIDRITPESMRAMVAWHWPGNLPELESFIQRAVKRTVGRTLAAPVVDLVAPSIAGPQRSTLEDIEREHILRMLRECHGVVTKAATRLGLPRTTLNARIKKLAISREDF